MLGTRGKKLLMNTKNYLKYFSIGIVLLVAGGAGVCFYRAQFASDLQIKQFNKERDTSFILDCFERDRYWLTNNPDFSPQFMIDHMSPQQNPKYFGKQQIRVLFCKETPIGFGAFYMKSFYEGKIHFLYVDKNYRGKGFSSVLMQYMIAQLVKQGAKFIKLCTRVNNQPARALYRKLGFKKSSPDEMGFVFFELRKQ